MRAIQKAASIGLICAIAAFICGAMGMRTTFADTAEDIAVYYNTYGGKYYHFDPECNLVDRQWLPMKQLFYSDLYSDDYDHLAPCVVCASNDEIIRTAQSNWPMYGASIAATSPFAHERMIDLSEDDIPLGQALDIAQWKVAEMVVREEEYVANLPYKASFLSLAINGVDTKVWIVCFFPESPSAFVYAVTIQSPTGEILSAEANHFLEFTKTWEAWGRDDYFFWTAEEKALYHEVYQQIPTRIMPEAGAISQVTALQIAIKEVQKIAGLSDEEIASYRVDFNYVPNWYVRQKDNAWLIMLRPSTGVGSMYQIELSAIDGTVFTFDQNDEAYPPA